MTTSTFSGLSKSVRTFAPVSDQVRHRKTEPTAPGRALASMVLAAMVTTLVIVADQIATTWRDSHLFVAWVLMWLVVFAGLALFASPAKALAQRTLRALNAWSQSRAVERAEARMWAFAKNDPRLLADLWGENALAEQAANFTDVAATVVAKLPKAEAVSAWERYVSEVVDERARTSRHVYL